MQENRDHFSSEIKSIYLKYILYKTFKLYWQLSSCFQCFPFPKKNSRLLSSFSLLLFLPAIYPFMTHWLINPSIHPSVHHPFIIHPSIQLSTIYPSHLSIHHSFIHSSIIIHLSSIIHSSITHHAFIHHPSIIYLDIHPTIHPIIHLLISKDNLSYY